MSQATQTKRFARIDTPLGEDVLLLRGFTMQDRLSESFRIEVDLLSESGQIDFDGIVGQAVTLQVDVGVDDKRYFNGIVANFSQVSSEGQLSAYHAVVMPAFWLLTLSSHCRIYQNERVPDILKKIFQAAHVEIDDRLHGTYQPMEFCVQYRETDFNFCSRLMEQEGIYYFYQHEQGKHTLVLADSKGAHEPFPGHASIDFRPYTSDTPNAKFIRHWSTCKSVESSRYAHTDFDFEKPRNDLFHREESPHPAPGRPMEIYDYPGGYKQTSIGEQLGKVRMGEIAGEGLVKQGVSDSPGIAVGYRFQLGRCPRVSFPRDEDYREYLVTSAIYAVQLQDFEAEGSSNHRPYECSFTVLPQDEQFRPLRTTPKPHVQGPQTAMVVGPAGQEIHTDKYGRIKVQFHWDRDGKRDEKSSCFIRVAQGWAGKNWGAIMIPRIGHEVVVEFLEGDPDRPLVTGSVYNADTMPPYPLEAKAAISGVKTNSTKGGGGYNEFSMDDTKGSELITQHAQRDMESKIEHDRRTTVVNNDDLHITTGNQTTKIDAGKSATEAMQSIELKVGQNRILIDQSGVTIEGITLKLTGQASTAIEAPIAEVTGTGMLKLKGGIAMIN